MDLPEITGKTEVSNAGQTPVSDLRPLIPEFEPTLFTS